MWNCPQCGALVDDALAYCWMCGESPDAAPRPRPKPRPERPRPAARRRRVFLRWLDGNPNRPPAGVTRRFGLNRLMFVTVLFAVVFALLRTVGAHPAVYAVVAAAIVVVGLAQVFLFGGKKPRKASVVAGAVPGALAVPCVWIVAIHLESAGRQPGLGDLIVAGVASFLLIVPMGVLGGFLGYLVGCVIAGTFLSRPGTPQDEDLPTESVDPLAASPDEPGK